MLFMSTRAGLIAGNHVVRIGAVNTRPTGNFHEIDYVHGLEARSTTATADDVEDFLDANNSGRQF